MRGTKKQNAQSFLLQSPHDFRHAGAEKDASRKPRKGGRQEETQWLHKVIEPFTSFIRYAWPAGSVWLRRNNVGRIMRGKTWFTYGLGTGTSDAVGGTCVLITQAMVGTVMMQLTVFEAKSEKGVLSDGQEQFLDNMRKAGARVLVGTEKNPPTI